MKKLLLSLLSAILLTAIFVTPAFADSGNSNMPGKAADLGWWQGLGNGISRTYGWGVTMSGGTAAYNSVRAIQVIDGLTDGQVPEPPSWASAPK